MVGQLPNGCGLISGANGDSGGVVAPIQVINESKVRWCSDWPECAHFSERRLEDETMFVRVRRRPRQIDATRGVRAAKPAKIGRG